MPIEIINDRSVWDSFVEMSPDKLLFHKWDFLKIIEKHSGCQFLPFGIFEKDDLICIFPLYFFKKNGIKFIKSFPYGSGIPYNGFLMKPDYYSSRQRQKERYLIRVAEEISKKIDSLSPNITDIFCGPRVQDIRPFKWMGFDIDDYYSCIIDVTIPPDSIWNSCDRECKRAIKSAEKLNLSLKETDDIATFYSIMNDRYQQQNLKFPNFGPEYFRDIMKTFPENVKMYFVNNEGKIVNLVMNYEFNDRISLWKGSINVDSSIHSTEFLIWEFIKMAHSKGLKTLELQGANTQRLCQFKSKFNPQTESYFSITKKDHIGKVSDLVYKKFLKN